MIDDFITTGTKGEQVRQAIIAGADAYVMQPFTTAVLVARHSLLGAFAE